MTPRYRLIAALCALTGLTSPLFAEPIMLEAEDGEIHLAQVATEAEGYSGSGYVDNIHDDNAKVTFQFTAPQGLYEVYIGYSTDDFKRGGVAIDGASWEVVFDDTSGQFTEAQAGKVYLDGGEQTLEIRRGWGYYRLDYVRLEPAELPQLEPIHSELTDSNATQAARDLYSYLREVYGSKTLSGQYGLDEYRRVRELTGESPAILGVDVIDYSPSRVEHGATPAGSVERWIAWQNQTNGILTVCWHWNAPADLIDDEQNPWWSGFYTRATTFDVEAVLADPDSERYQLLIRDIDVISEEMKKLQDADIPVLWRPLHEASGAWFWWGAKGPEPFKQLWRLMYDRMVNHHGINNLIWVYTHEKPDWYPGDDVVDMIGMDRYEPAGSYMTTDWEQAIEQFGGSKLVSLSEVGAPPDAARMRQTGTRWLTFIVWEGQFIDRIPRGFLEAVYHDEDVVNLGDLPWNQQ